MSSTTDVKWRRVSEKHYWEMLEVLPPKMMLGHYFLVGEAVRHNSDGYAMYDAFKKQKDRHYRATKPMTVKEFEKTFQKERAFA